MEELIERLSVLEGKLMVFRRNCEAHILIEKGENVGIIAVDALNISHRIAEAEMEIHSMWKLLKEIHESAG